jgi:uncharacterized protein YbbK (DUF523 family)
MSIKSQTTFTSGLKPLRLGVSACLLGAKVRFDGGHKRNRFLLEELGKHFEFVPFCPEVAIGMGTPRPPIRLVGDLQAPRAVGSKDHSLDVTDALREYSAITAGRLDGLCGFVFKKDSPSCGMERVKVYSDTGMPQRKGAGLFARAIQEANPLMPVEEEGRLNDPGLRENFVTRVLVYARWQALRQQPRGAGYRRRDPLGQAPWFEYFKAPLIHSIAPLPVAAPPIMSEQPGLVVATDAPGGIETGCRVYRYAGKIDIHDAIRPVHSLDPTRTDKDMPPRPVTSRFDLQIADDPVADIHENVPDRTGCAVNGHHNTPFDPDGSLQAILLKNVLR